VQSKRQGQLAVTKCAGLYQASHGLKRNMRGKCKMKKRLAIILLALGVLGMFTGCNKDKENKKEESQQEVSLVNEKGLVVAADVENIKD